jgi:hypothetical protein
MFTERFVKSTLLVDVVEASGAISISDRGFIISDERDYRKSMVYRGVNGMSLSFCESVGLNRKCISTKQKFLVQTLKMVQAKMFGGRFVPQYTTKRNESCACMVQTPLP